MSMSLSALGGTKLPTVTTANGDVTVTLPTGLGFASGADYEVDISEGRGWVKVGSKTNLQFEVTSLAVATCVCIVYAVKAKGKAQVN